MSAPHRSSRIAVTLLGLTALVGVAGLILFSGSFGVIFQVFIDLRRLGWSLVWVLAIHLLVVACDAVAWWILLPTPDRGSVGLLFWARWVREAANRLLPVAQIGGELAGARVLVCRGMTKPLAGASVLLDKIAEGFSLIAFGILGIGLLVALRGEVAMTSALLFSVVFPLAGASALALACRAGLPGVVQARLEAIANGKNWSILAPINGFAGAVKSTYRADRLVVGTGLHVVAWLLGAGEIWFVLVLIGHPIGLVQAIVLESLAQVITSAGFMVPAAMGVQEGAYVAIGVVVGLPAEAALALSLVKRARQVLLGLPALIGWQAAEVHALLISPAGRPEPDKATAPSSDSNAYVRRFARVLLRPLAGTSLAPNHITGLRIATGLAAGAACAIGTAEWNHGAAILWMISAMLDRADGEFARLTRRCSKSGYRLDYYGDVLVNSLIFLAIGINLRSVATEHWSILLGAFTAAAVATASILAEALELRIGAKTVPSRSGFDLDDVIFVLVPVIWLGLLMPLLVGAAIGGAVACLWIGRRLSSLIRADEPGELPAR